LAETGTDYDDVGFSGGDDPLFLSLKTEGKLPFGQVPMWEEPGGLCMVQSASIVRHLARKNGLTGKDETEASHCDSLWEFLVDCNRVSRQHLLTTDPAKKKELAISLVDIELPKAMGRLETILQKNGTGYFVGNQLTYVDLAWWYAIENLSDQGLINLSLTPHLTNFKAAIESRPRISAFRTSPKRHPIQFLFPRYVMYSYKPNNNANKGLIAAAFAGIKIEFPDFKFGTENKTPEFLKKNPNGEVPTLDTPDGPIYESNAICRYIARKGDDKGLYGANEYEASLVDQWIEWYRSKIERDYYTWLFPIFGWATFDKEKYEAAKVGIAKNFGTINNHLETTGYIVGKRVTVADICLFCNMVSGFTHLFTPDYLKPFPHLVSWVKRLSELEQFKKYVTIEMCTREKQPNEIKWE